MLFLPLLLEERVPATTQSTTESKTKDHALQAEQVEKAVMDVAIIIGGNILHVPLPNPSMVLHPMRRHLLPSHPPLPLPCTIPSLHCLVMVQQVHFFYLDSSLSSHLSIPTSTSSMTILNHLPTLGMMRIILSTRMLMFLVPLIMSLNLLLLPPLSLECFCAKRSILISYPAKQGVGGMSLTRNYPEGKFQIRL